MLVAELEPLKFRVEGDLKRRWDDLLARKKITQQDAGVALVAWVVDQDDLLQSMVFGQVDPQPDLAATVAARMARERGSRPVPPRITHIKGGKVTHPPAEGPRGRQ